MTRTFWIQQAVLARIATHQSPTERIARMSIANDLVEQVVVVANALEDSGEAPWTKPPVKKGRHPNDLGRKS